MYVYEMHKTHGDFVRTGKRRYLNANKYAPLMFFTGPNEISINNISAIHQILGSKGLPKGDCESSIARDHKLNMFIDLFSLFATYGQAGAPPHHCILKRAEA